jgi:hypothetical protein
VDKDVVLEWFWKEKMWFGKGVVIDQWLFRSWSMCLMPNTEIE